MSLGIDWAWIADHLDDAWQQFLEHLTLTGIAVGVGFVISVLLAVVALRWRRSYGPIATTSGLLYTIPSIAAFALLTPAFGLTILTAEVALVSYTLLILVRNIVAGIDAVPPEAIEAARGMGYRDREIFLRVQLPLALPTIVAGLRIATVTTIGLVTVTALITYGGFGQMILTGLRRQFFTQILFGIALSVAFATVMDGVLVLAERLLTPWSRRRTAA